MGMDISPEEGGLKDKIELGPDDTSGGILDFLKQKAGGDGSEATETPEPEVGPSLKLDVDTIVNLIASQAALFKSKNEAERQSFIAKYKTVIPGYLRLFGLDKVLEFFTINIKPLMAKEITLPAWIPLLIAGGILAGGVFLINPDRIKEPPESKPEKKEQPDESAKD